MTDFLFEPRDIAAQTAYLCGPLLQRVQRNKAGPKGPACDDSGRHGISKMHVNHGASSSRNQRHHKNDYAIARLMEIGR